ncbi:MAG: CRISPR-associated protein Cas5 [Thermorudis peleae]|nr:CRISPR-associated protein Cas5 [Thermorudis peleae]
MNAIHEPVVRIHITALTASFRAPSFVAYQLSLGVPPLATMFGLLSAASGRWITPEHVPWLAYRLTYAARTMDLETIYAVVRKDPLATPRFDERNIVLREFLVQPELDLFLPADWGPIFERPRYQLVLGRSQDIAMVEAIESAELEPVESGAVAGVLLPIDVVVRNGVTAVLHNLPVAFTPDPDRRPIRVTLFGVIEGQRSTLGVRTTMLADGREWLIRDRRSGIVVPLYRREWMLYGT